MARFQTAEYEPGEYIVRQGQLGDRFFIVTNGEVCVVDEGKDGSSSRVLCVLYDGHHFGEFWCVDPRENLLGLRMMAVLRSSFRAVRRACQRSLLREQPRNASVIARTKTTTKFMDRAHFQPFAKEDAKSVASLACCAACVA